MCNVRTLAIMSDIVSYSYYNSYVCPRVHLRFVFHYLNKILINLYFGLCICMPPGYCNDHMALTIQHWKLWNVGIFSVLTCNSCNMGMSDLPENAWAWWSKCKCICFRLITSTHVANNILLTCSWTEIFHIIDCIYSRVSIVVFYCQN